jgi:fumarate hydratase subunit beta
MKELKIPLKEEGMKGLKIGDVVFLTGTIFTARDQAHKRLVEAINKRRKPPIDLKGAIIYYCGPARAPKGKAIGSCGPTTSSRMDEFTPILLKSGLKGMVGKGGRSLDVATAIRKHKAVYFLTYAGCGALLSKFVKKAEPVAYKDLGPERISR